ncbi:hypothetical protein Pint_25980 [Pistacia integerrima]|uniref:Uncharacterized protein n=1 Tax=Pistacia integerrima TaxID=434235 RepID=A0ACC0YDY0_9ROSI|nr:hypothetical protein Pint_25980 [Pistacia integerrima]
MEQPHKEHRARQAGSSARKKKGKLDKNKQENKQNPKVLNCICFYSICESEEIAVAGVEKEQRRLHIPTIDRSYALDGGCLFGWWQVGKSLVIKLLIKHYTKHTVLEMEVTGLKWKESLLKRTVSRQNINLKYKSHLVYGKSASTSTTSSNGVQDSSEDEESDDDEFFRPKGEGNKKLREGLYNDNFNTEDCSKFRSYENIKKWKEEEIYESIRVCFVMGDCSKAARRNQGSESNFEDDEDNDVYGGFEDLEIGEKHESHPIGDSRNGIIQNEDESAIEERRLKKLVLRAKFDAHMVAEEEIDNKQGAKFHRRQPKEVGLIDKMKEEIELRKQMNISKLNDLDEVALVEIEGFRTGTFVRLEIHDVPFEMVEYFDPFHPILVGGIGLGEENIG